VRFRSRGLPPPPRGGRLVCAAVTTNLDLGSLVSHRGQILRAWPDRFFAGAAQFVGRSNPFFCTCLDERSRVVAHLAVHLHRGCADPCPDGFLAFAIRRLAVTVAELPKMLRHVMRPSRWRSRVWKISQVTFDQSPRGFHLIGSQTYSAIQRGDVCIAGSRATRIILFRFRPSVGR